MGFRHTGVCVPTAWASVRDPAFIRDPAF